MKKMITLLFTLALAMFSLPQMSVASTMMTEPFKLGIIIDGLHYQGGYGNYSWASPNEIIATLEDSPTRLATRNELLTLFDFFNLPINRQSFDLNAFIYFTNLFEPTWGDNFNHTFIDGIYQPEDNTPIDYTPRALLGVIGPIYHIEQPQPPTFDDYNTYVFQSFGFWDFGNDVKMDAGISAWTVTPVPEPGTYLRFLFGIAGFLFYQHGKNRADDMNADH